MPTANSTAASSDIKKFLIYSNTGGERDIRRLVLEFKYEESVFDPSIRAFALVTDAAAKPDFSVINTLIEDLKIAGGEKTEIIFTDNYDEEYELTLYVDEIIGINDTTRNQQFLLTFCSEELLNNEITRVRKKYEGKPSDSIVKILTEVLETSKDIETDETLNEFNFLGNNYKPFYWCMSLAKKSVPFKKGQVAGYLFYENYYGYKFKAIDELFNQGPKKKFVYNDTTLLPPGYDAKVLDFTFESNIEFQKNLNMGTYNTEKFEYGPHEQEYEENKFSYEDQNGAIIPTTKKTRINELINQDFISKPSRYFTYMKDIGALPKGSNLKSQLEKCTEQNLEIPEIAVQSAMRYQQAFTIKLEITIPANLGINVGDIVFVDIPQISSAKRNLSPEELNGGLYMISELCHRLTPSRSVSRLVLTRDSYMR